MEVYIHQVDGQYSDDWLFAAYLGFKKKGATIINFEDIDEVPFNNLNHVVVTGVDESIHYFQKYGVPVPKPFNIPDCLNDEYFLGRNVKVMSMGEFKNDKTLPVFVKPQGRYKEFSSGVLTKADTKRLALHDVPDESLVMTSSVVDFDSEYRCFVYNSKLVGIKHYQGDFSNLNIDFYKLLNMIKYFEVYAPVAYSLDIGIINHPVGGMSSMYLVEVQDMWSIGHYGLDIQNYSSMLRDRWFQIIRAKK
jgi:hypothetical protein